MAEAQYDHCSNCGEEVTWDSDFCPHCGVIFEAAGGVKCDDHPERAAGGICIICRKLVCNKCGVRKHGRTFCREHKEIEVQQDWARIFQSTDINDAELVKSVLQEAGYTVQVQNFSSIGFIWEGGGDSSLSRSALSKPAKIFVPIPEYLNASKVLQAWKDSNPVRDESDTDLP